MLRKLSFEYVLTPAGIERGRRLVIDAAGVIASVESATTGPWDGKLALPGMPNAHSHAFQRALVGVPESRATDSFWSWRNAMYAMANAIEPEDLRIIAARAFDDMLRAGFTSVGEFHYLHHRRNGTRDAEMALALQAAARETGIRMTLLPVLYQQGGFGQPPLPEQSRFVHETLDDFARLLEQVRHEPCGVAPHSLRAVALEELPKLVALADELLGQDCPIHIHVSEQIREVAECRAAYGRPPIQCLADSIDLDARWSLVHATHAEAAEMDIIHARHPNIVLCPLTEAYLGDGLFPLPEFSARGGTFAIGSDSNARIDAVEELRLAEYGQRLATRSRSVLSGASGLGMTLWRAAANAGARSLGYQGGAIVAGAVADLVVLDLDNSLFGGVAPEHVLDAWLIGGSAGEIAAVYVGGERRVDHGAIDRHLDSARFAATMRRLHGSAQLKA